MTIEQALEHSLKTGTPVILGGWFVQAISTTSTVCTNKNYQLLGIWEEQPWKTWTNFGVMDWIEIAPADGMEIYDAYKAASVSYEQEERAAIQLENAQHACTCDFISLLQLGCKCGGV
jgi:hypothetical protein